MENQIVYERVYGRSDGIRYRLKKDHLAVVPILGYVIPLKKGMLSDGATWARDLGAVEYGWRRIWAYIIGKIMHSPTNRKTDGWFAHDDICNTGKIAGKRVSNFTASLCLSLLIWRDGYKVEAFTWFFATFLRGGGEARKNGMFWVSNG